MKDWVYCWFALFLKCKSAVCCYYTYRGDLLLGVWIYPPSDYWGSFAIVHQPDLLLLIPSSAHRGINPAFLWACVHSLSSRRHGVPSLLTASGNKRTLKDKLLTIDSVLTLDRPTGLCTLVRMENRKITGWLLPPIESNVSVLIATGPVSLEGLASFCRSVHNTWE